MRRELARQFVVLARGSWGAVSFSTSDGTHPAADLARVARRDAAHVPQATPATQRSFFARQLAGDLAHSAPCVQERFLVGSNRSHANRRSRSVVASMQDPIKA